jgi:hypothetical protein
VAAALLQYSGSSSAAAAAVEVAAGATAQQRRRQGGSSVAAVGRAMVALAARWQWWQRRGRALATALQRRQDVTKLEYFGTYLRYLPTNPMSQHYDSNHDIRSHFLSHNII